MVERYRSNQSVYCGETKALRSPDAINCRSFLKRGETSRFEPFAAAQIFLDLRYLAREPL